MAMDRYKPFPLQHWDDDPECRHLTVYIDDSGDVRIRTSSPDRTGTRISREAAPTIIYYLMRALKMTVLDLPPEFLGLAEGIAEDAR